MKTFLNHNGTTTQRKKRFILRCVVVPLWLISFSALAAPYEYAPPSCDFSVTFPEKPFIEKKCVGGKCEEVATYTRTADASSLSFRLTCNPQDSGILTKTTYDDMKATLAAMVKDAHVAPFSANSAAMADGTRTSIALGTGARANRAVMYMAQMWLGQRSALVLEGDMTGAKNKDIEDEFTRVLRSLKSKIAQPALTKTP